MKHNNLLYRFSGAALVPVLALAVGASAYAQDNHDDRRDDNRYNQRDNSRNNQRNDNRYQQNDNRYSQGDNRRGDDHNRGRDFHFDNNYRDHFAQHYRGDADHWRNRRDRVRFDRGQRIPVGYRLQPVPDAYYRDVPPPPPGYRYGYYEGYVVAYDPTTRVVGDVLDLVNAMGH